MAVCHPPVPSAAIGTIMHMCKTMTTVFFSTVVLLVVVAEVTCLESKIHKPKREVWAREPEIESKILFMEWLIDGCNPPMPPCTDAPICLPYPIRGKKYRRFDGSDNTDGFPIRGMAGMDLNHRMTYSFGDRVQKMGLKDAPNPLLLSYELFRNKGNTIEKKSNILGNSGRSQLVHFFGKYVVEEVVNTRAMSCPVEFSHIDIPKEEAVDEWSDWGIEKMPFVRGQYDPDSGTSPQNQRVPINRVTPWIDASSVYGSSRMWATTLRRQHTGLIEPDGLLASDESGLFPEYNWMNLGFNNHPTCLNHSYYDLYKRGFPSGRLKGFGYANGNENPAMFSISTIWFRWHNALARYIKSRHENLNGDILFQEARRWVIATMQRVIAYEWYPTIFLNPLPKYTGYDVSSDPQLEVGVVTAALRFGHTYIPKVINLRLPANLSCKGHSYSVEGNVFTRGGIRLCQSYWTGQDALFQYLEKPSGTFDTLGPGHVLMGLASQEARSEGNVMVEDVREYLYGPMSFSRRDLAAIDIQRNRDFGVPDYHTWRKHFNLPPLKNLLEISDSITGQIVTRKLLEKAEELYKGGLVDLYVGGTLESRGEVPGPLFDAMINKDFAAIRDGDFYWYENKFSGHFSTEEIERINQVRFSDIILYVTSLTHDDIQENVFALESIENLNYKCKKVFGETRKRCHRPEWPEDGKLCYHMPEYDGPDEVEPCNPLRQHDYTYGIVLGISLSAIVLFVILMVMVGMLKWKVATSILQQYKFTLLLLSKMGKMDASSRHVRSFEALEFMGVKNGSRRVVVLLNMKKRAIELWGSLGEQLRVLPLSMFKNIDMILGTDGQHLVIKVPYEYDVVLQFILTEHRDQALNVMNLFLKDTRVSALFQSWTLYKTLKHTVTYDDRQIILNNFFTYMSIQAQTIYKTGAIWNPGELKRRYAQIEHVKLNKTEFAEALGITSNSNFFKKLFPLIAGTKSSYIGAREFRDFFLAFSRGPVKSKIYILFDMHDIEGRGRLNFDQFQDLLMNLAEISMNRLTEEDLNSAVDELMKEAEKYDVDEFRARDLKELLQVHGDIIGLANLDLHGPNVPERDLYKEKALEQNMSNFDAAMMAASDLHDTVLSRRNDPVDTEYPSIVVKTDVRRLSRIGRMIFDIKLKWHQYMFILIVLVSSACTTAYYLIESDSTPERTFLHEYLGVTAMLPRATGSAILLLYSILPITTARILNTYLRNTELRHIFPFDAMIDVHKAIAWIAAAYAAVHSILSIVYFATLTSKEPAYLECLVNYLDEEKGERGNFNDWLLRTWTGTTGCVLVILLMIIHLYSMPSFRRQAFRWFWVSHMAHALFYPFLLVHSTAHFMRIPTLANPVMVSLLVYVIDHLLRMRRHVIALDVASFFLLPSNTFKLYVKKPLYFTFKPGQWIRLSCAALNPDEFHPLTIASMPNYDYLEFYVQVVGPWTHNLRRVYNSRKLQKKLYPKVYIEGPFGPDRHWRDYDVAIMIANDDKVISFISAIKEAVHYGNGTLPIQCRKMYFLWSTTNQNQLEWVVATLAQLDERDPRRFLSPHICITESADRYDFRTLMLYLCEEHFFKVRGRSLFTGLRTITHFGKPSIKSFLTSIRKIQRVQSYCVFHAGDHQTKREIIDIICSLNEVTRGISQFEFVSVK